MSDRARKPVPKPAPELVPYWEAAKRHRAGAAELQCLRKILVSAVAILSALPGGRL